MCPHVYFVARLVYGVYTVYIDTKQNIFNIKFSSMKGRLKNTYFLVFHCTLYASVVPEWVLRLESRWGRYGSQVNAVTLGKRWIPGRFYPGHMV